MNVSMHQVEIVHAEVNLLSGGAHFAEQGGRTGTLSMFFGNAADCQRVADKLAELAEAMRKQSGEQAA